MRRQVDVEQAEEPRMKSEPQFKTKFRRYLTDIKTIAMELGKLKSSQIGFVTQAYPDDVISKEYLNEMISGCVQLVEQHTQEVATKSGNKKKKVKRGGEEGNNKKKGGGIVAPVMLKDELLQFLAEANLPGLNDKVFDIVMQEGYGIPTFVSSLLGYYFLVNGLKDNEAPNKPCRADDLMKSYFGNIFDLVYQKEAEKAREQYKEIQRLASEGDQYSKDLIKTWKKDENGNLMKLCNRKTKDGQGVFMSLFNEERIIQANLSSITSFLTDKIDKKSTDPQMLQIIEDLPAITERIQLANEKLKQLKAQYEPTQNH